jgi:hypothetical protein
VLPAQGLFIRHAKKLAFTNVDIQSMAAHARPCCWVEDVDEADFLHLFLPEKRAAAAFLLKAAHRFRVWESSRIPDASLDFVEYRRYDWCLSLVSAGRGLAQSGQQTCPPTSHLRNLRPQQSRVPRALPRPCDAHHAAAWFLDRAMWEARTEARTEFVYLLTWPSQAAMRAAWATLMADAEWNDIKRVTAAEHGDLVGDNKDRTLQLTDYSPPLA